MDGWVAQFDRFVATCTPEPPLAMRASLARRVTIAATSGTEDGWPSCLPSAISWGFKGLWPSSCLLSIQSAGNHQSRGLLADLDAGDLLAFGRVDNGDVVTQHIAHATIAAV